MPTKKNSFLIDASKFDKAVQIDNPQEFEKYLTELMNLANEYYDEVYLKYKKNPDIEKFNICRINFSQIKSIIESKANSTSLINKIYIEAWISTLYSGKHALNLEPETEEQLNVLSQKIQKIGSEFQQLLEKKSSIDSSDKSYTRLLKYIDDFAHFWNTDEKRLLTDATFNFAETLIEQENFQQALYHFETAKNLYAEAATHHAPDSANYIMLLKFSEQTNDRLQEIKNQHSEILTNESSKKLSLRFQNLSGSWTLVNEFSKKNQMEIKRFTKVVNQTSKIKRKLNDESSYPETKKQKLDFVTLACKKILDKFDELNINIDLSELTNTKKFFDERKAIAHNNYAIYQIEYLNNKGKNFTHHKKMELLQKAERLLSDSAEFYEKAHLAKEKGNIIECIAAINSCQENLKIQNQPFAHQKDSIIETQKFRTKSTIASNNKMRQYQNTFSTRLAYRFFNTKLPENNGQTTKSIIKNISP